MFRAATARVQLGRALGRRNASTNVTVQNLESRWKTLSTAEQNTIAKQLEEAQKGDWKVLSLEDKKAACKYTNDFSTEIIAHLLMRSLFKTTLHSVPMVPASL